MTLNAKPKVYQARAPSRASGIKSTQQYDSRSFFCFREEFLLALAPLKSSLPALCIRLSTCFTRKRWEFCHAPLFQARLNFVDGLFHTVSYLFIKREMASRDFASLWLGETKWLMQRRNCVAWEIAEICQPFELAVFLNFPLLPRSFLHFRSFVLRNAFRARSVPMPSVAAASSSAHFAAFYSVVWGFWSRHSHESCSPVDGSIPPVLMAVASPAPTANTLLVVV